MKRHPITKILIYIAIAALIFTTLAPILGSFGG